MCLPSLYALVGMKFSFFASFQWCRAYKMQIANIGLFNLHLNEPRRGCVGRVWRSKAQVDMRNIWRSLFANGVEINDHTEGLIFY